MSTRLYVRLERDSALPGSRSEWILRDRQGATLRRGRDALSELPDAGVIVGVIEHSLIATRALRLPPGRRARAPAALANAMEPYLLSDPAANHVAVLGAAHSGEAVLAAISREWLESCAHALSQARRPLAALVAESSMIGRTPGVWTAVCRADGGFLCPDDARVVALDAAPDAAPPQGLRWELDRLAAEATKPRLLRVHRDQPFDVAAWRAATGIEIEDSGRWDWAEATASADRGASRAFVDILRQIERPSGVRASALAQWRVPALLAVLLVAAHVGATATAWWQARAERERLRAAIAADFTRLVGPNEPLVDAVLQSRRALHGAQRAAGRYAPDDFVALLDRLVAAASAARAPLADVVRLQYRSGVLAIEWRSTPASALEPLARTLREEGLRVELANHGAGARVALGAAP